MPTFTTMRVSLQWTETANSITDVKCGLQLSTTQTVVAGAQVVAVDVVAVAAVVDDVVRDVVAAWAAGEVVEAAGAVVNGDGQARASRGARAEPGRVGSVKISWQRP